MCMCSFLGEKMERLPELSHNYMITIKIPQYLIKFADNTTNPMPNYYNQIFRLPYGTRYPDSFKEDVITNYKLSMFELRTDIIKHDNDLFKRFNLFKIENYVDFDYDELYEELITNSIIILSKQELCEYYYKVFDYTIYTRCKENSKCSINKLEKFCVANYKLTLMYFSDFKNNQCAIYIENYKIPICLCASNFCDNYKHSGINKSSEICITKICFLYNHKRYHELRCKIIIRKPSYYKILDELIK